MENSAKMISSVDVKVKRLIGHHRETLERLRESKLENDELKNINEKQLKEINELKEKIKLLKIAKSTEIKEGTADARLKINEMIREIDKCIGLLNR